jgi:GntR family transcriptional regulator/MocR family aminotransferase
VLERLPGAAGLHLGARCRDQRLDAVAWARAALAAGVAVEPLAAYHQLGAMAGLAFGYGLVPASRIDEAVARLAACLPRGRRRGAGRSSGPRPS